MSVKQQKSRLFVRLEKPVSPEILPEKIEKRYTFEKSVIYLIRIASREAFFWVMRRLGRRSK